MKIQLNLEKNVETKENPRKTVKNSVKLDNARWNSAKTSKTQLQLVRTQ